MVQTLVSVVILLLLYFPFISIYDLPFSFLPFVEAWFSSVWIFTLNISIKNTPFPKVSTIGLFIFFSFHEINLYFLHSMLPFAGKNLLPKLKEFFVASFVFFLTFYSLFYCFDYRFVGKECEFHSLKKIPLIFTSLNKLKSSKLQRNI